MIYDFEDISLSNKNGTKYAYRVIFAYLQTLDEYYRMGFF